MAEVTHADQRHPDTSTTKVACRARCRSGSVSLQGRVFRLLGDVGGRRSTRRFSWDLPPKSGGESNAVGLDVAAH